MTIIGIQPANSTSTVNSFTDVILPAAAGQVKFDYGYNPAFIEVYQNGVRLIPNQDFTATDGSTVILTIAAETGDTLEIISETGASTGGAAYTLTKDAIIATLCFTPMHDTTNIVSSFNSRNGDVALTYQDVVSALNFTPLSTSGAYVSTITIGTNAPRSGQVTISAADITGLLTPLGWGPGGSGGTGGNVSIYAQATETYHVITHSDISNSILTYSATYNPLQVEVFLNGIKLTNSDYTATDGQHITLTNPVTEGDVLNVLSVGNVSYTTSQIPEGTNLYYTDARAQAVVTNSIPSILANASLTGTPTTPTPTTNDNSTLVANTAFVNALIHSLVPATSGTGLSLTNTGYYTLSGGLILQWGSVSGVSSSSSVTVTLPIAFPNGGFAAFATANSSASSPVEVVITSPSQLTISTSSATPVSYYWFVLGH